MSAGMTDYRSDIRAVRRAGMSVEDGLGFTVCGGQLVGGQDASPEIAAMNGWAIEDIARELRAKGAKAEEQT